MLQKLKLTYDKAIKKVENETHRKIKEKKKETLQDEKARI